MNLRAWIPIVAAASTLAAGCGPREAGEVELGRYPLDGLDGVLTTSGVSFDPEVSADGGGSIRITAGAPATVMLFETGDLDVEDARLIYRAKLRASEVIGQAYLEMWCQFAGKGEFFARGLESPLSGTVEWTTQEIPFFLKKGENPDNIKLNVVIQGTGTVWVDDVVVAKGPLL